MKTFGMGWLPYVTKPSPNKSTVHGRQQAVLEQRRHGRGIKSVPQIFPGGEVAVERDGHVFIAPDAVFDRFVILFAMNQGLP